MRKISLVLICILLSLVGCTLQFYTNKLTFTFSLEGIPKADVDNYVISGRNKSWGNVNEITRNNKVTFSRLTPGEWTFNISVRNKQGASIGEASYTANITKDSRSNPNVVIPLGVYRDFTGPNFGFANDGSGRFQTREGRYTMTGFGSDNWGYSYYDADFDDHTLSVNLSSTHNLDDDSFGYGIFFRSRDGSLDNCYQLSITTTGKWSLTKNQNGTRTFINSTGDWDNIPHHYPATLRVECRGDKFIVYFGDYLVETITDSTFSKGKAGLCGYDHKEFNRTLAYQFNSFEISL